METPASGPRSFDIWALQDMQEIVTESRSASDLQAFAFANKADP
jgi:chromosome partitioning protein